MIKRHLCQRWIRLPKLLTSFQIDRKGKKKWKVRMRREKAMFSQAHDSPPIAYSTNTCLFIEERSITGSARFLQLVSLKETHTKTSLYLSISHYLEVWSRHVHQCASCLFMLLLLLFWYSQQLLPLHLHDFLFLSPHLLLWPWTSLPAAREPSVPNELETLKLPVSEDY